jgi:hypothetical protein
MVDSHQTSQGDRERRLAEVNARLAEIAPEERRVFFSNYRWIWCGMAIFLPLEGLALLIRHEAGLILDAAGFLGLAVCMVRYFWLVRKSMPLEKERGRLLTERRRLRKVTRSR